MAFAMGNSGGGGRRRRYGSSSLSEMNIVPLVDVVLVLLIIFMLTAQAMQYGMEVEVPKTRNSSTSAQDLPVITITKNSDLYLGERQVNINELGAAVKKKYGAKQQFVYLKADRNTTWDPMAQVISKLSEEKIGVRLVTQPEDSRR
jgi:biopolymer transport protein ExbD